MELRVLQYFLVVAREENITRAADMLHITQPTLSRQLTELEEEMGVPLLIRGKRRTTLTDEGMLLRRRAEEMLELSEKTKREVGSASRDIAGVVSIGAAEASAAEALAELMKVFSRQYSKVRFELVSGNADQIKERLENGLLDVGLLLEPVELDKYEYVRLPQQDHWGVLLRVDDPLAEKEALTAADLVDRPLLVSNRSTVRGRLSEQFGFHDAFQGVNIFSTYNLIGNAATLVEQRLGCALCIRGAVSHYDPARFAFRPLMPDIPLSAVLVWQKWQRFSPAAKKFIEEAKMLFEHEEGRN